MHIRARAIEAAMVLLGALMATPRLGYANQDLGATPSPPESTRVEDACTDGMDNDRDSVLDCADADCFRDPACQPDGQPENTNARCSDFVDNDGNGATDCDDVACLQTGVTACLGSWDADSAAASGAPPEAIQGLDDTLDDITPDELSGALNDTEGELNDILCSDGLDNDNDGRTDCADLGCRFGIDVTVCRGDVGLRFTVVANVSETYDFEDKQFDTRFSKLQVRALGPIPLIQDSFFLLSARLEKTPRLTFALFQVPIGGGHKVNVNSGGGGLSFGLIRSTAKQLLLEPPYYLYRAFEQGNGAAIEFSGPVPVLPSGTLSYRVFAAGGSGRWAGNVGGRYFTYDNTNYTYSLGAQLHWNIIGYHDRFDTPFIYRPVALTVATRVGAKYDQRAQERYPAANMGLVLRWGRVHLAAENYIKRELNFRNYQNAFNIEAAVLLWPKRLLLAADYGQFIATRFTNPPEVLETDLRRLRDERQFRVALHCYVWSKTGVVTLLYKDNSAKRRGEPREPDRELLLEAQVRF